MIFNRKNVAFEEPPPNPLPKGIFLCRNISIGLFFNLISSIILKIMFFSTFPGISKPEDLNELIFVFLISIISYKLIGQKQDSKL